MYRIKLFLLFLVICVAGMNAQPPIAYYPFNGNANDSTVNGNNGTALNVTYGTNRFGTPGAAAVFSGLIGDGSAIDIPTLNSFQYLPITYSCWIYLSGASIPAGSTMTVIGRERSDFSGIEGALAVFPDGDSQNTFRYVTPSLFTFEDIRPASNTWYHATLTINSSAIMSLYVNGVLYDTIHSTPSALTGSTSVPFRIGGSTLETGSINPTYPRYSFPGKIDDVRIYDRALSLSEIQDLYSEPNPLPVELVSFNATIKGRRVELAWKTATEVNNAGFDIERNVNGNWSKIGFVEGHGTTNAHQSYSYTDASAKGTVSYRLKQIDRDGKFEYSSVVNATVALTISNYELRQNHPNPFNPTTTIRYVLPYSSRVKLTIHDLLGREVATLVNEVQSAGWKDVNWNARDVSSGIYFYRIQAGDFVDIKRMVLLK